jgi:pilus assembly protein CpaE
MLSHHPSGLAVVAAPNRPAEMRSFDPDVVTRLLDMVSSHFDYVVFDMPRTWFSWTDSVPAPNWLFIVSEMTVPGLNMPQLVGAIRERLGDSPQVSSTVSATLFSGGEKPRLQALGRFRRGDWNFYRLVREAIDAACRSRSGVATRSRRTEGCRPAAAKRAFATEQKKLALARADEAIFEAGRS